MITWPEADKKYLQEDKVEIVIQINGKRRGELQVAINMAEEDVMKKVYEINNVSELIKDKKIRKVIFVPNKIDMMNLIFSFELRSFIKKLILNLEIIIKNISEPSNLNSVV